MKKYTFSLALVAVALFAAHTEVANADHSMGMHWSRTTPVLTLKLGDNVSSTWDPYLATTSKKWTLSSVLDTRIVKGAWKWNCGAVWGRVEVCAGKYGENGWLGIATLWSTGEHITKATVKMNDTYFTMAAYNKPMWRQSVLCQEVGHAFGLDHQDVDFYNTNLGTCMDYSLDPSRDDGLGTNLYPNAHDYQMLETIYQHLDITSTVSQSTVATNTNADVLDSDEDSDPKKWGKEVKRSADGHASLFEKDLGNGQKVFKHVFWAEPRKGPHQEK